MKKLIFALIAGTALAGAAQAQTTGPRAYVGVGVATADHDYNLAGTTNGSSDGYKASGKIFGGYDFDRTWGAEVGYTDFRSSDYNYTFNGATGRATSDGHSFYVAGKATAPINEQFEVFGKLGVARNKSSLSATNAVFNRDESKTEGYGALGAQYNINKQVALTLEYERYGKSKDFGAKADVWTVAAKYNF